jgi:hypothetical protein
LDVERIPKMETSFAMEVNYAGVQCTDVGTYAAVLREGVLHDHGRSNGKRRTGNGIMVRPRNRQVYWSRKS